LLLDHVAYGQRLIGGDQGANQANEEVIHAKILTFRLRESRHKRLGGSGLPWAKNSPFRADDFVSKGAQ
jgi:hypothetical protein